MSRRSRYDEIHDKYQTTSNRKQGIKYERLASLVFKSLELRGVIIHDKKLIGKSGVPSQIDVIAEDKGKKKRRILVECKDFDIKGKNVGIGIVRDFLSVVNDMKPRPDALIISCNNFSPYAIKFATYNKIKLGILRQIMDKDLEDRITKIVFDFSYETTPEVSAELLFPDEETKDEFQRSMREKDISDIYLSDSGVFFEIPNGEIHSINDFINAKVVEYMRNNPTEDCGIISIHLIQSHIKVKDAAPLPIKGVKIAFIRRSYSAKLESCSEKVAEMIFRILGDEAEESIIFGDDLGRFKIDPVTHEVIENPEIVEIPGWQRSFVKGSKITWSKMIDYTCLQIEYSEDKATKKNIIKGLIMPSPPQQQWLIKDGRIYEWILDPKDYQRVFSGELVDTHSGALDVVAEDISTPQKMAVYLEKTAIKLSQPLHDLIPWILSERGGKMGKSKLRIFTGRDYAVLDPILWELGKKGTVMLDSENIILI